MVHIKLKDIINENQSQKWIKEAIEKDLAYLQERSKSRFAKIII
jgi:hypothetical protein